MLLNDDADKGKPAIALRDTDRQDRDAMRSQTPSSDRGSPTINRQPTPGGMSELSQGESSVIGVLSSVGAQICRYVS